LRGPRRSRDDILNFRRSVARIALLPADCLAGETTAFDLLVNGDYAGHWAVTSVGRAAVTWLGGISVETEPCDGDEDKVIAQIRPTIPPSRLGVEETNLHPKYVVARVETAILQVAVELHPQRLSTEAFLLEVVGDSDDRREAKVGIQAIDRLREVGLLAERDDGLIEPTPAAVRAAERLG
jgi:hypothetical protein